jgi:ribosomal protein S18 acetylase RimI-like enzyme
MWMGMQGPDAERKRGYLSNVCVAPQVRQRGVGAALLLQAQKAAQRWGMPKNLTNFCIYLDKTFLTHVAHLSSLLVVNRGKQLVRPCRGLK